MRAPVRIAATVSIAAAVSLVAGALAGCSNVTTGTVAQTTEPGPPLTTSRTPTSSRPTIGALPRLPNETLPAPHAPTVPAPANSSTISCRDYAKLDEETQFAIVDAIMAAQPEPIYNANIVPVFKSLADAMCDVVPSAAVSEVLTGGGPPK